ncbi:MAG: glycosyltransferase family 39 protein [Flavobacteriales bacterium]|nr:glycosyltransferase family 39 protein [Flavobacteriales bacterium]
MRRPWNDPFVLLTAAVFAGLLLPMLVQDGMFMDGLLYATVAHNEANGFGTFWEPRASQLGLAGLRTFHEHPPLTFGLQALWFRVWGSAFWVERAYSLFTALITAGLVVVLWRKLAPKDRPERALAWWPVLLWIVMPTVHWCFHNNMQENTLGVFTTGAVLLLVMAHQGRTWSLTLAAGLMVFAASMAKGVPGFFPLAAPLTLALAFDTQRLPRAFIQMLVMAAVVGVAYGLLWTLPEARESLGTYVQARLLHRITEAPTVDSRFRILGDVFFAALGPVLLATLVLLVARGKGVASGWVRRPALALLLTASAGVLPLMLTRVQKSFYMAPALPLLALAIAMISAPAMSSLLGRLRPEGPLSRGIRVFALVALTGVALASVFLFGRPSRDADMLHDVDRIGARVPPRSLIASEPGHWDRWNLQCYLMRRHFISIDPAGRGHAWAISDLKAPADSLRWKEVDADLLTLRLWQRRVP